MREIHGEMLVQREAKLSKSALAVYCKLVCEDGLSETCENTRPRFRFFCARNPRQQRQGRGRICRHRGNAQQECFT